MVVVGAGMAGASLACALGPLPLRLAVVEAGAVGRSAARGPDHRATALSHATRRVFEAIGVWPHLADAVAPIHEIHVSDRGHIGVARLQAHDLQLPALGYVAPNRILGGALTAALQGLDGLELLSPARVEGLTRHAAGLELSVRRRSRVATLRAGLVVAADGTESLLRDMLGIGIDRHGYGTSAVVTSVAATQPHHGRAFERFTPAGPIALLPLPEDRYGVVWTVHSGQQVEALLAMDERAFLRALESHFGGRVPGLRQAGPRHAYPLTRVHARQLIAEHAALVGNAAHTLHPVAGQGFNLGLRDVAMLAEAVARGLRSGHSPGSREVLDRYAAGRRRDLRRTGAMTDGLLRTFHSTLGPIVAARNVGLIGLDLLGPLRRAFSRSATGVAADMPWLARGRPLSTLPEDSP